MDSQHIECCTGALRMQLERSKLKDEEARYRYLVTSTKTSPEYRKEAMAKLQAIREKINKLSRESKANS
jgi:sulfur transfer protein SufE